MTTESKFVVAVFLAVVLGCGAADEEHAVLHGGQTPDIDEPKIGINLRRNDGALLFDFQICGEKPSPLAIRSLVVTDEDEVICEVARTPTGLISSWQYGSSSDGFEIRSCRAISPGKHSICASGGGWGCQDFEIDSSGQPRLMRGWCRPHEGSPD